MTTTKKDIGYMAQRSTNPKEVMAFLSALPPGTLESGVSTIPDEDVRRRFKLRSPSMTKALIKLGVPSDVVAGYYSGINNNLESLTAKVYHKTTFSNENIMHQQSDSVHFSSCMSSGALSSEVGSYYTDYIEDDLNAYASGDLGMLVVGSHAHDLPGNDGVSHKGDGRGFVSRAKIRVLWKVKDWNPMLRKFSFSHPAAIMVDRIYGNVAHVVHNGIPELVKWNNATYQLPILVRTSVAGAARPLNSNRFELQKDEPLVYPHDGYMDTLSSFTTSTSSFTTSTNYDTVSLFHINYSGWGVIDANKALSESLQLKAYNHLRKERAQNVNMVSPSKLFIERASNRVVCRAGNINGDAYKDWRYGAFRERSKEKCYLALTFKAFNDNVLTPWIKEFATSVDNKSKAFKFRRGLEMDMKISVSPTLTIFVNVRPYLFSNELEVIALIYSHELHDITHAHDANYHFTERLSLTGRYEKGSGTCSFVRLNGFSSYRTFAERCAHYLPREEYNKSNVAKLYEVITELQERIDALITIPLDNPRKKRYNGKTLKKLLAY